MPPPWSGRSTVLVVRIGLHSTAMSAAAFQDLDRPAAKSGQPLGIIWYIEYAIDHIPLDPDHPLRFRSNFPGNLREHLLTKMRWQIRVILRHVQALG
jgi:hypothetical protein